MMRPTKEGLLKQRKTLELALSELQRGKVRRTPGRLYRASAEMGGPRLDTTRHRIASLEKRIEQIDAKLSVVIVTEAPFHAATSALRTADITLRQEP